MRLMSVHCVPLIVLLVLVACAPAPARTIDTAVSGTQSARIQPAPSKTLILGVRYELTEVAPKITTGTSSDGMKRLFNASLA